jgi:molybdopterin-guanine dinucleotide biosynthesis protein A
MGKPAGVLLAGGLSSRMGGGDKPLRLLAGRPILSHVITRLQPQVSVVVLNANGDPARFREWGLPIVPDGIAGFPGPLAGIHAGMVWARENHPEISHILSIPADLPFLPLNLAAELQAVHTASGADIIIAMSAGRRHPAVGLWPVSLAPALHRAITRDNLRKVGDFADRYRVALAEFSVAPIDPFYNINSQDDLIRAESMAG